MTGKQMSIGVAVVIALAVVGYFFFFMSNPFFNNVQNGIPTVPSIGDTNTGEPQSVVVQDVKAGAGAEATVGKSVTVSYVGKLTDGSVFDQSSDHGGSFSFILGAGQVIPGWEQGIQGMKVGGDRILVIPSALGYGAQQVGPIPPNSTLIFQVHLIDVSTSSAPYAPEGTSAE